MHALLIYDISDDKKRAKIADALDLSRQSIHNWRESKKHFGVGKGVLGDNKEKINELVRRML